MKTKKIPAAVRAYMSALGAKGGATTGKTKARDPEAMRAAANKRWAKHNASKRDSGAA